MRTHLLRRDLLKAIASGAVAAPPVFCGPAPDPFRPVTKVAMAGGVPTFTLDGKPFLLPVMETYDAEGEQFAGFAKAGTRVFSMNTNTGEDFFNRGWPTWQGPDKWDYFGLDKWVRRALATRPDALIMPRVYVCEPQWWLEQNPSEVELWEGGSPFRPGAPAGRRAKAMHASIASAKWREAMAEGMRRLLDHIHNSDYADRVFGYLLAGLNTEEWWHWGSNTWGFSEPTRKGFQAWLRRKYATDDALRAAWRRPDASFDTAAVPSSKERDFRGDTIRDPARFMHVIDFYDYWNEVVPEAIDHFAAVLKEKTKRTKLAGAFYAFLYQNPEPEHGHNALWRYLESPNLDFVFVTSGFGNRKLGGGDYGRQTPLSVQLRGKVFFFDNDYSSHLNTERDRQRMLAKPGLTEAEKERIRNIPPQDFGDRESRGTNTWEDIALFRRVAGFTLTSGMFQSFFDIARGSYDSPELWAEVSKLNAMFERATRYDRSSVAEVLVVADEASCSYMTSRGGRYGESPVLRSALRDVQFRLPKIGAPHDQILLDDLERVDMRRYKLIVFLNAYHVTERQRKAVEKAVKGGRRIVMWCYAPGLFRGNVMSTDLMRELTGIRLAVAEGDSFVPAQIDLAAAGHPILKPLSAVGRTGTPRQCRAIWADDPEAVTLGTLAGSGKPALVLKNMGSWTSVYAITPDLAPAIYRELARMAGVHIYSERDDTFYVSRSFACLHADGPGRRTIAWTRPCALWDAISEESLARGARQYSRDMRHGETVILRYKA